MNNTLYEEDAKQIAHNFTQDKLYKSDNQDFSRSDIGLTHRNGGLAKYDKYVFVSSSIPKHNLINLAIEAKKTETLLVIRGLIDNSYPKTIEFLQDIIKKSEIGIIIDPKLFKQFHINNVPSFVLAEKTKPCLASQSCMSPKYDKLVGNVSLDYAFAELHSKGEVAYE